MGYVKIVVKNNKIYTIDGIDTTVKIDDDGIINTINFKSRKLANDTHKRNKNIRITFSQD